MCSFFCCQSDVVFMATHTHLSTHELRRRLELVRGATSPSERRRPTDLAYSNNGNCRGTLAASIKAAVLLSQVVGAVFCMALLMC